MTALLMSIICMCGGGGATATAPAVRLDPPPTTVAPVPVLFTEESVNGRCVGAEFLLGHFSPGWDVARMSRIMYRESRCQPGVSNSCCHGLLQIHESWARYVSSRIGPWNVYDAAYNIRAAALVWLAQGYSAWSTS